MLLKNKQLFPWNNVSNKCGNLGGKIMYTSQLKSTDSIYFTKKKQTNKPYIYSGNLALWSVCILVLDKKDLGQQTWLCLLRARFSQCCALESEVRQRIRRSPNRMCGSLFHGKIGHKSPSGEAELRYQCVGRVT